MPLNIAPLPFEWNLPPIDGIPPMLGTVVDKVGAVASVTGIGYAQSILINEVAQQWGIFTQTGTRILGTAHVTGIEYESQYGVSDAPLEDGGFVSYNKVRVPYRARILMVCDGSEVGETGFTLNLQQIAQTITGEAGRAVRQSFITVLETVVADTSFYVVKTPEFSYPNANVIGYRWRRSTQNGVTMLTAEIEVQEIRRTTTTAFQQTLTPAGQALVSNGTVQPTTPSAAVSASITQAPS